ncbi:SulP family inorganic anion transporter [Candidatus Solincola sp.]|nr:SulP family inorganic anion transporter [Actinomycetota bacterium]MDI7252266.1 SulP family inorganic anion transporter [Actinomycetota bacterium]
MKEVRRDKRRRGMRFRPWWLEYRREWLPHDLAAGFATWLLAVPLGMAFAGIAGVPVQHGLYAVCLSSLGYALLGTCLHLHVGPTAAVSAVSAAVVAGPAGGDPRRFVALSVLLALETGVLLLLGGALRAGFVAKFLSHPVLEGYVAGAALYIAVGRLPAMFGLDPRGGNFFQEVANVLGRAGSWSFAALAVGVGCLVLLFTVDRAAPRFPAVLAVVALAMLASRAFHLPDRGVAVVGAVPGGLRLLSLSGLEVRDATTLLPGALALAALAFADSLALARACAIRHGYRLDPNREMVALGAANLASGLLSGIAVDASYSRTAAGEAAGGRTPLASIVCSLLTLLTMLLFTGLFRYIPHAALSAVVIFAVLRLVRPGEMLRLRRVSGSDFALALGSLFGVLLFGVLTGIGVGVLLSLAGVMARVSRPHTAVLGVDESGERHGDLREDRGFRPYSPYLVIYRFDGPIIFANVDLLVEEVLELVEGSRPRPLVVVLDCEMVFDMDTTAARELRRLLGKLREGGTELYLARVHAPLRGFLEREGLEVELGRENLFPTVRDAARAFRRRYPDLS